VKRQTNGECRTCEIIINIARHHFHNNVTNQGALQAQLLRECDQLSDIDGPTAAAHCRQVINANIAQIFADMHTNKPAHQTCVDIKECKPMTVRHSCIIWRQRTKFWKTRFG
jgi:hypothetical protein